MAHVVLTQVVAGGVTGVLARATWMLCVAVCVAPVPRSARPQSTDSAVVVPGMRYRAGWLNRFLFGKDYRDLWTTPIEAPVLDLATYRGGLTPDRRGGFGQTSSLHFRGSDGRRHIFRSVDKDPSRRLAEELQGTFVQSIIQDQISALNPAAALVVAPILDAAGVLHSAPVLFVMPDVPELGEFREEFAGTLGLMMENPDEGVGRSPGFAGARLISGSERALADVERGPANRFHKREFLKARLLDVFLGDRDRHAGQWRWARFETDTGFVWVPIPEDRDQAFINQDGLIMWATRHFFDRKYVVFEETYPPIESITWNGWDLDRYILTELPRATWDSVALDLQTRLSDGVIRNAVKQMPVPFYEKRGADLTNALLARRNALGDMARRYYAMLSRSAEIRGTDIDELVTVEWIDAESLHVSVAPLGPNGEAAGTPHFSRIFARSETDEVRIFTHGGDDKIVVRGSGEGITIRAIGGGGSDTMADESQSKVFFYDSGRQTVFVPGRSTRIDTRTYRAPPSADPAHRQPVDWGSWTRPVPVIRYSPDVGWYFGAGLVSDRYGFRSHPYKTKISFQTSWASSSDVPSVRFEGDFRDIGRSVHARVSIGTSTIAIVRFHGFGNETSATGLSESYEVEQVQGHVAPMLAVESGWVRVSFGPIFKYVRTVDEPGTLLAAAEPYGSGIFRQVGGRVALTVDGRAAMRGFNATLRGDVYPAIWDVSSVFGSAAGTIAGFVGDGNRSPRVAGRVGGRKVWGRFPYFEAAYVGGAGTLRGFAEQRFAGDANAFANVEARVPIGAVPLIVPTKLGIVGITDVGRVFWAGEVSNTWHSAFGGGLYFSVFGSGNVFSAIVARSAERTGLYMDAGFMF